MRKVLMIRKSTNAMPSERIQLSNQRDNLERGFSARAGAADRGAATAPRPAGGAPKSCMCHSLASWPARRNGYCPPPGRPPLPDPVPEVLRPLTEPHAGGEACRAAFPLHAHPRNRHGREGGEGVGVERRAAG